MGREVQDRLAFQKKVSLNVKVFALKSNESLKTKFGPPGIIFLTEPLVSEAHSIRLSNHVTQVSEEQQILPITTWVPN